MSAIFRAWGKLIRTDETLVLIVSYMGKGFNDSPRVIFDYMKDNNEYDKYHCIWAFENPNKFADVEAVTIDTLKYFQTALKAKYWITNTNIERGLKFKKTDQVYLNTWHGIALKHIGNDCPGRKDYNFNTVDYLVVSGDYDERIWESAFNADEKTYLKSGMPRNERLWLSTDEERQKLRAQLGIPNDKRAILYAPTWRDSKDGGKSYEIEIPIHFDKWKKEIGEDYIVLFRSHHQTTKVIGVEYDDFIRDVSDYPIVNDLIIASDMLITDYSAISFDYSITCKPIFCFAYDYDTYLAERGTYFDIDERYPNKACRTEEELLRRIRGIDYDAECSNSRRFRDAFIQYGIGATEMCTKALFGR